MTYNLAFVWRGRCAPPLGIVIKGGLERWRSLLARPAFLSRDRDCLNVRGSSCNTLPLANLPCSVAINMKSREKHGSSWPSPRSVIRAAILACLAIITYVNLDLPALATKASSYSDRLFVDNIVPPFVIPKDEPIINNIRLFVQDQFASIVYRPVAGYIPVPDPPDGFDFAKASRTCGWPDLDGFGINVETLLNCIQAEQRKFEKRKFEAGWAVRPLISISHRPSSAKGKLSGRAQDSFPSIPLDHLQGTCHLQPMEYLTDFFCSSSCLVKIVTVVLPFLLAMLSPTHLPLSSTSSFPIVVPAEPSGVPCEANSKDNAGLPLRVRNHGTHGQVPKRPPHPLIRGFPPRSRAGHRSDLFPLSRLPRIHSRIRSLFMPQQSLGHDCALASLRQQTRRRMVSAAPCRYQPNGESSCRAFTARRTGTCSDLPPSASDHGSCLASTDVLGRAAGFLTQTPWMDSRRLV